MSTKNIAIGILFALVLLAPVSAQGDTSIPACDEDELEIIDEKIGEHLVDLSVIIAGDQDDIVQVMDDMTILQRKHWTEVGFDNIPECAEKYTRYFEFGRAIDNYALAYGLVATSAVARLLGDEDQAERMSNQAAKHVREANRAFNNVYPQDEE